jgi:hypothetical protein
MQTPTRALPAISPSPRGVFKAPWRERHGEVVLTAVDSGGRRVAEVVVPLDGDVAAETAELYQLLDRRDPVGARRAAFRLL